MTIDEALEAICTKVLGGWVTADERAGLRDALAAHATDQHMAGWNACLAHLGVGLPDGIQGALTAATERGRAEAAEARLATANEGREFIRDARDTAIRRYRLAERARDLLSKHLAEARAQVDRLTAERDEAREREAAAERERDTLRALLERCEGVTAAYMACIEAHNRGSFERAAALLTDIRTALHQSKGAEP